ncbi:S9 family peptidase [Streptomyces sp. UNOC14_S4]|uniref:alpha/beta hydrolase family protein n=1 Tax=Streptomyces sp. UNOC14_S4 TaxID=2872340 RepID=UPI001E5BAD9F|nr:hypothetical protein [Streptomyces sp. UNOC14_S4]MCC3767918.1 hypothetical protein [Streptomyces sp. UNOC14_S4]
MRTQATVTVTSHATSTPRRRRLAVLGAALVLATTAAPAMAATATTTATGTATAADAHGHGHGRDAHRGEVVSVSLLDRIPQATAAQQVHDRGYAGETAVPRYGVDHYRVVYRTVDAQGRPTTASGLLSLPENDRRELPVVAYEHGTMASKGEAPSGVPGEKEAPGVRADSVLFAGAGYATVAPDYLGLGSGPGLHPYGHLPSEVTASVDLLRAARTAVHDQGRRLERGVHVTGFSQGGVAAMGLGRALQQGADPHFTLAGLAPVSGPYDSQHAEAPAGLEKGTLHGKNTNFLFAYWLTAMNRTYHLYKDPSEVFQAPYAATMESLFDGTHDSGQIFAALPDTPQQLFTPHLVDWALHPTGELLRAYQESDTGCTGWHPRIPVRLFAARGDKDVAYENALSCTRSLRAADADVTLTDVGDIEHSPSRRAALPEALAWFRGQGK